MFSRQPHSLLSGRNEILRLKASRVEAQDDQEYIGGAPTHLDAIRIRYSMVDTRSMPKITREHIY